MKKLAITLAALAMATPALAGPFDPPKRYQGEPKIRYIVLPVPLSEMPKRCKQKANPLAPLMGCAYTLKNPRLCVIHIPTHNVPNLTLSMFLYPIITPK